MKGAAGSAPARCRQPLRLAWPAEWLAMAVILLSITVLGVSFYWLDRCQAVPPEQADVRSGLDREAADAIVGRGSELLGLEQPAAIWAQRLASGRASLGDYLMRVFVSPGYLAGQSDDRKFLADVNLVLKGTMLSEPDLDAAAGVLNSLGSRLAYLNQTLQDSHYSGIIRLTGEPTRLRTFVLANDRLPAGEEAVGVMTFTGEARLTGQKAHFRLFVDGRVHQTTAVECAEPNLTHQYNVQWDTRREEPGRHTLALLVQTSDGRGVWQSLEYYEVPEVADLQTGQVQTVAFDTDRTAWYRLPVADRQALLMVEGADGTLDLQLRNQQNRTVATAATAGERPAALRYSAADTDGDYFYVRLAAGQSGTGQETGGKIGCILAPAWGIARPLSDPESLFCVLEQRGDKILIPDKTGEPGWQDAADYQVTDATSRLADLALQLPDGSKAGIAGPFDPEDTEYGLYVDTGVSQLKLAALAMEGSAAGLEITCAGENGANKTIGSDGKVPLDFSDNQLSLVVTGFDGSSRTYEIHILRPPHSAGYDQVLEQFPLSYRSSLWLLHLKQPDWQFVAESDNLQWAAFVAAQGELDRSLVEAGSSPSSWVEAGSPVYDGSSWKAAATPVIEYFADPRNFLNETDLFQFERLTYDASAHTRAGIGAIIQNSFMAAGNGQNVDYAGMLLEAGEKAGISPYFLASKIIQEMGRNGESPLASGELSGYEGVYNFYNIGSTPNPDVADGARINGARFALYGNDADQGEITDEEAEWLLPWRSPRQAIIGGAIWIARRYVQIGQDTLYLQKFDLVGSDGLYIHQYAQNIQMAWAEGRRTRTAYEGIGLLSQPFIFRIPIFEGMPAAPQSLP